MHAASFLLTPHTHPRPRRYVRLNRTRLKGQEGDEEAATGLSVLYDVSRFIFWLLVPACGLPPGHETNNLTPLPLPLSCFHLGAPDHDGADGALHALPHRVPLPAPPRAPPQLQAAGVSAGGPGAVVSGKGWSFVRGSERSHTASLFHNAIRDAALPLDALGKSDSVHYLMLPQYEEGRLDPACEERMATLQSVIELGRMVRVALVAVCWVGSLVDWLVGQCTR